MRLYRNDDMTAACQWAGTQDDANRLFGRGQWQQVEVPTDKPGLLAWLNANAFDPRATSTPAPITCPECEMAGNCEDHPRGQHGTAKPFTPMSVEHPAYVVSLATDEAFEALPLPRQLHFAALAMENARDRIVTERQHITLSAQRP